MPMTITVSAAGEGFLHEPEEWLDATIVDILDEEGVYGPQFKWILHVDGDDTDRETWAYCSQTLSPKSKLYGWLKSFYDLEIDQAIDMRDLIGDRCQIQFERYQGTAPDGSDLEKEKVVKIRAPKDGRQKKPVQKMRPAPADDDTPF